MVIGVTNQWERDVKEKTTNKKRKSLGRRKARSLARRHRGNTLDLAAVKFRNGVGCCVLEGGKKKKICKSIPRREYSNEFSNQKLSAAAAALVIRQHVSYFIQNNQSGGVTPRLDEL